MATPEEHVFSTTLIPSLACVGSLSKESADGVPGWRSLATPPTETLRNTQEERGGVLSPDPLGDECVHHAHGRDEKGSESQPSCPFYEGAFRQWWQCESSRTLLGGSHPLTLPQGGGAGVIPPILEALVTQQAV